MAKRGRKKVNCVDLFDRVFVELHAGENTAKFRITDNHVFREEELGVYFENGFSVITIRVEKEKKELLDKALKEIKEHYGLDYKVIDGRLDTYFGKIYIPDELVDEDEEVTAARLALQS